MDQWRKKFWQNQILQSEMTRFLWKKKKKNLHKQILIESHLYVTTLNTSTSCLSISTITVSSELKSKVFFFFVFCCCHFLLIHHKQRSKRPNEKKSITCQEVWPDDAILIYEQKSLFVSPINWIIVLVSNETQSFFSSPSLSLSLIKTNWRNW